MTKRCELEESRMELMASAASIRCGFFPYSLSSRSSKIDRNLTLHVPSCNSTSLSLLTPRARVGISGFFGGRNSHLAKASSEEIPTELAEDTKFVPLDDDEPIYGPPAILLIGFEADELEKIQMFLRELDGEFLKIIYCTESMIKKTVWDAMHTEQPNLEAVKIAKSLPRVCIMSGLSGEEMIMFIDAFPEAGLEPAVFAALVPNSAEKLLGEVIEEVMGDHEMLSAKK